MVASGTGARSVIAGHTHGRITGMPKYFATCLETGVVVANCVAWVGESYGFGSMRLP